MSWSFHAIGSSGNGMIAGVGFSSIALVEYLPTVFSLPFSSSVKVPSVKH